MIEVNEIAGFVSSCKNVDYLQMVRRAIEDRLRNLGVKVEPLRDPLPFTPASLKEAVRKDLGL